MEALFKKKVSLQYLLGSVLSNVTSPDSLGIVNSVVLYYGCEKVYNLTRKNVNNQSNRGHQVMRRQSASKNCRVNIIILQ